MDWIFTSLSWYAYLLIIGLVFFPLTKRIFQRFSFDLGYPFAKVLAIIFLSYVTYVLGTLKILPFSRMTLFLLIGLSILINFYFNSKDKKVKITRSALYIILFEEFLFLGAFLLWTFVRSQEPSLQSLEKFMDFGFINSILRSSFFPPKDIWYTPLPINYYYFGHLTGAFLIRLSDVVSAVGYNLILSTIFALGVTQIFSFVANIIKTYSQKIKTFSLIVFGIFGAFVVNLGGNLHTVYLFTKGYPNEHPIPFWEILSKYNPISYWYPNATRFIPFTIHEFPSYSYVVADLHGHVFDIPFVLLTLAVLFLFFTSNITLKTKYFIQNALFLGFLTAIHYMTNAFDGPIYMLLTILLLLFLFGFNLRFLFAIFIIVASFIIFASPFSAHFSPFVAGIGVNCSPDFLTNIKSFGPFLFEAGNCQKSAPWMLFVLWGFFLISFILFLAVKNQKYTSKLVEKLDNFFLIIYSFGVFLVVIPEYFYIKDIYPQHFRANTMFKLGYQAFIMMGISSIVTLFLIKQKKSIKNFILTVVYVFFASFVIIYPFFSIPSYYGLLDRQPNLDGSQWLYREHPEDKEIVDYLNRNVKGQPVILEAQGDSYTDYERISANTGLPTVAGWWVHEWLWRGSADVVGKRIPEVEALYKSKNIKETTRLIKKYSIKYVIVSQLERQKYSELQDEKFKKIGTLIFTSSDGLGAIYQIK